MTHEVTEAKQDNPDERGLLNALPTSPIATADDPHALKSIEGIEAGLFNRVRSGELTARVMPLRHTFTPGVYLREIFMERATFVVGQQHKTEHINIITKGRALVMLDGEMLSLEAGDSFVSQAGVRKVLFIVEDTNWMTVHDNPDDCRDIPTLEERLIEKSPTFLDHQKNMIDLDAMQKTLEAK